MHGIHSGATRVAPSPSASGPWRAPIAASTAVLELVASEQPRLLAFQVHVLRNSPMSFAVEQLATAFAVPADKLGEAILRACKHLDRMETHRGAWRSPSSVVKEPNLAALHHVCAARLARTTNAKHRQRLLVIQRRIVAAYEQARTRAWLEDFLGPLPVKKQEGPSDDR
jgi:hypothetical protein